VRGNFYAESTNEHELWLMAEPKYLIRQIMIMAFTTPEECNQVVKSLTPSRGKCHNLFEEIISDEPAPFTLLISRSSGQPEAIQQVSAFKIKGPIVTCTHRTYFPGDSVAGAELLILTRDCGADDSFEVRFDWQK
jgi:hypothetical protein